MTGTGVLGPRVWARVGPGQQGARGARLLRTAALPRAAPAAGERPTWAGALVRAGGRLGHRARDTRHADRGRRGEPPELGYCALRFACAYISWADVAPSGNPEGAGGRRSPPLSPFCPVLPEGRAGREARGVRCSPGERHQLRGPESQACTWNYGKFHDWAFLCQASQLCGKLSPLSRQSWSSADPGTLFMKECQLPSFPRPGNVSHSVLALC